MIFREILPIARRLYKDYIRAYLRLLLAVVALLLITSGTTSLQPLLLQQAFDKILKAKDPLFLTWLPLAIVILCIAQAVTGYYSTVFINRFNAGITADMRSALYRHILDNDIEFYSEHGSGQLISRVTSEISGIVHAIQQFLNAWVRQFITSLGLVGVMLYQSVDLTLVSLLSLAVAFYPIAQITRRLKKLARQTSETTGLLYARLLESFQGIRVIKAFAKEEVEALKVDGYISEVKRINSKMLAVAGITPSIIQGLAGIAVAFVIWYGGYQVIHERMTEGQLMAFITSLLMVSRPIRTLTNAGSTMTSGVVYAERFFSILDAKPKRASRDEGTAISITAGEIRFENVCFSYPDNTVALKDVSFTLSAGKRTALVGHSGSGKSTCVNLLLRFYDSTSGSIFIDGQDLREASIRSVREKMALVSQDIFIFDDTAKNNIGYGKDNATDEQIFAAAKAAQCHDFAMNLRNGYETRLGFGGESLSGGQKQRIALARAFVRNAPIMLLDEATSSLDPKTEAEIQFALDQLTRNRTTIIIAHRLSTVMSADTIVLLERGEVKATGTHAELFNKCPAYRQLFGI